MARLSPKNGLIGIATIVIMLYIIAIVVGTFSTAGTAVSSTLPVGLAGVMTVSTNGLNVGASNSLSNVVVALTGTFSWVSNAYPLTITVTGNSIAALGSNTVATANGPIISTTYIATTNGGSYQVASNALFYNILSIQLSGVTPSANPSITATATENYNGVNLNSAPATFAQNTISGNNAITVTLGTAASQYNTVYNNVTTILPFVGVIAIVGAVVILLDMFGLGDIFNFG